MDLPRLRKFWLFLAICAVSCGSAFSGTPSTKTCTLLAMLYNEAFEDEQDVPQIPLTFDAHIAIHAEVEKRTHGSCPFSSGDRVIFLIHSPSRTLGGYWFHAKRFFVTIGQSDEEKTGREWDLLGIDWPLETVGPQMENLICSDGSITVRTLVGDAERQIFGPFTVLHNGDLVVSLGTIDTIQAKPDRGVRVFSLEYPGDSNGMPFRPEFQFSAEQGSGVFALGNTKSNLKCFWPDKKNR